MIEFRTMCINVCKCQANEWIVHWYYEMAVQHSQWTIVICEIFGLNDLNSHDLLVGNRMRVNRGGFWWQYCMKPGWKCKHKHWTYHNNNIMPHCGMIVEGISTIGLWKRFLSISFVYILNRIWYLSSLIKINHVQLHRDLHEFPNEIHGN